MRSFIQGDRGPGPGVGRGKMDRRVRLGRAFLVSLRRLTIAFAAASLLALPSCRRPLGRDATDAGVSPDDGSPSVGDAPRGDILALDAPVGDARLDLATDGPRDV